jgi:hypothetical protein
MHAIDASRFGREAVAFWLLLEEIAKQMAIA